MPARLPALRWAPRAALAAILLQMLSGCGPIRNQFAPPCPGSAILGDAADINIYRPSSTPGGGRDLTDLVLHGRVVAIQGTCQPGDHRDQLAVSASMAVELTRGPAMQGREAIVPLFIAVVSQGDTIIDKRTYNMSAVFPSNIDRVTMTPGNINMVLPISGGKTGADYMIVAGFQLAPDQLARSLQNQQP